MHFIWEYMKPYRGRIGLACAVKFLGTLAELSLPYILAYVIDSVVPLGEFRMVVWWGLFMIFMSVLTRFLNVTANRIAVGVSRKSIYELRSDLFRKVANLSGPRFDAFGLPSITSRMTSDSYNVQDFMTRIQTIGIRGPIMMFGGIVMTLLLDVPLAMVLVLMIPIILAVVLTISWKGTPLYNVVQQALDNVVRVMRENITGIRVVKALSREEHETARFGKVNQDYTKKDIHASTIMALPGPFMDLCLNVGLTIVVVLGASRVNAGKTEPGVILAFLTYFNLILMSCRSINRIFVMYSKASASARRIAQIMQDPADLLVEPSEGNPAEAPSAAATWDRNSDIPMTRENPDPSTRRSSQCARDAWEQSDLEISGDTKAPRRPRGSIDFCHVSFSYAGDVEHKAAVEDIDFHLQPGESLGIIGPTGSGKTTIVNLLMRFYDVQKGEILVDGHNVRSYGKDDLHRLFGRVFQNDFIENATIRENIDFGRSLPQEQIRRAAKDAMADEYIAQLEGQYAYVAAIHGANLSGGQKQRILVARALAGRPQILILDDASSALDYQTDARLRQNIRKNYQGTTIIMIAQRVSSVMSMDHILVMDNGRMLAYGTHSELLESCRAYRDLYESQMGGM